MPTNENCSWSVGGSVLIRRAAAAAELRLQGLRAGREKITHTHEAVVRPLAVTWGDGGGEGGWGDGGTNWRTPQQANRSVGGANKKIVEGGEATTYGLTANATGATLAALPLPLSGGGHGSWRGGRSVRPH